MLIMIALAACAVALAGCKVVSEPEPIAVQSVTINGSSTLTLEFAETRMLTATVYPYNADDRTVTWSSSNTDAVGVNCFDGTITANNVGTSIITAQAGGKSATCTVTVKPQAVGVNHVSLSETTITLEPNARRILTATVHPDNADDKSITWSSSNPEVARVYSDGVNDGMVVAINEGTATITAHVGECTASCTVYVNETFVEQPDYTVPVEVESITLNTDTLILEPNTTSQLTAEVMPSNADDKTVVWRTSDYWVATVDYYDGTVTAHNEGTAIITAQAGGKTAECEVTVRHIANPVTGVTLDNETLTLTREDEYTLTATVTPSNADYQSVTWTSSDYEVATLDVDYRNNGTVTIKAVKVGTAIITATTEEGGFKATCDVTVNPITIESIRLSPTLLLAPGETKDIGCIVMPDDVDDRTVIWSSSDETIATVDDKGKFTGVTAGKATITVTARIGGATATCEVTVHNHSYSEGKCTVCGANPTMKGGTINKNGVLTSCGGYEATVVIPEGVTGIGNMAFYNDYNCKTLTSVTIPDSVKTIGNMAFYNCTKLTSVTIGTGVTSIGKQAFDNCLSLASVDIPNSVKSIGDSAFRKTGLASVTIPNSVTSIGNSAFSGCTSLKSVKIPASVTSIGDSAFENCWKTMTIEFEGTIAQWNAIAGSGNIDITRIICSDGHIGVKDIPTYLNISNKTVTGYYSGIPANLVIPDGVTRIGSRAFDGCTSLTDVTIPDSVTSIGENAFNKSNLKSVTIGNGMKSIDDAAFCGCTNLTNVTIPDSVTSIESAAFSACTSLRNVTIPASVTSIGSSAFYRCTSLTSVTIPASVTSIGSNAFYNCTSLTKVTIPDGVKSIGGNAFEGCQNLSSVTIPGSVTSWDWAFYKCTGLTSVVISNGVTSIGVCAFYKCTNLMSVTIPASVMSIGGSAFNDCTSLKTVNYSGTKAQWNAITKGTTWNSNTDSYTIICTDGSLSK